MKKLFVLLTIMTLVISLCGCSITFIDKEGINGPTPSKPETSDNGTASSSENESSQGQKEGTDILLVCPMEGSMYVTSSITLKPDFTFDMQVNLLEGFGNLKGNYEYGEYGVITFTVSSKDFNGFAGDNVEVFELQPNSENEYTIVISDVDSIGALHNGAVFSKE